MTYTAQHCPGDVASYKFKIHRGFMSNKDLKDPIKIQECFNRGEYLIKEMEALIQLHKYRKIKNTYYKDQEDPFKDFSALNH